MDWTDTIRARRNALHLTQGELARRVGVSAESIASWESARRRPSAAAYKLHAEALGLNGAALAQFQRSTGHEPAAPRKYATLARLSRPLSMLSAEIATYPWPSLVTNERYEIVAWNRAANAVAELDFATDLAGPGERQLLRMAASAHFRPKLISWDAVISHLAGHYKNDQVALAEGAADPYFAELVQYIFTNHMDLAPHLMEIWANAEPFHADTRNEVDLVWRTSRGEDLRFTGVFTTFNDFDAAWAFDWHPADAVTWEWIEANRDAAPAGGDCFESGGKQTSWRASLREARRTAGLTRVEASERTHGAVSASAIDAYERAKRFPSREKLLALLEGLHLDGVHTNAILLSAGMAPEPSDFARFLLNEPPRFGFAHPGGITQWSPENLREEIGTAAYPALAVDSHCNIVAANPAMRRLLDLEESAIIAGNGEANLIGALACEPPHSWLLNWDEVVRAMAPFQIEPYQAGGAGNGSNPAGETALAQALARIDPAIMSDLAEALAGMPEPNTVRSVSPVRWQAPGSEELRFDCIISPYNPSNPLWTISWHPANAATWRALRRQD
jgi:transcriptional regulator with XRE-family HTH domain